MPAGRYNFTLDFLGQALIMSFMRSMRPLSRIFRSDAAPPPAAPVGIVAALQDGPVLRGQAGLMDGAPPAEPALTHDAQVRIAQLIDAGNIDFAELSTEANGGALLSIAGLCADQRYLSTLLDGADPKRIAALVTDGSSSRIRRFAAERIEDPVELRHLLKQFRGKDKSVYRIIKQKCDALRIEEQKSFQVESNAAAACASLERHGHRIYDAVYEPTLEHFTVRWLALEQHATAEIQRRARHALDRCREIVAEHARQLAEHAQRRAFEESQRVAQAESLARERDALLAREQAAAAAAAAQEQARLAAEQDRAAQAAAEGNV